MLCAIRVKDNKAWNNSGYANFFFAIREGLEMLFSQFSKFEFFNFKMTFSKTNQPTFFIRLSKTYKILVFEEGLLCENF